MKRICTFLLCALFAFPYFIKAQSVITYAGNGTTGAITLATTKLSCPFTGPWGLAFDSKGNLWVAEETGSIIKVILPSGMVYNREGAWNMPGYKEGTGYGTSRFNQPTGIAVGPGDTIYVADMGNNLIRKITPYLNVNPQTASWFAGRLGSNGGVMGYVNNIASLAEFNGPTDLTVDANGIVYVADAGNNCIRKILKNGTVSLYAGQPLVAGGFQDGALTSAKFNYPTGICLASNGDIYVADDSGQRIRKISGGTVSTVGNITCPPLWLPNDVAIDPSGNLYVTDQNRVLKITGSKVYFYAGPYGRDTAGLVNASGIAARFNNVMGVVVNPSNSNIIYVAYQSNNVIRQITLCSLAKPTFTKSGDKLTCSTSGMTYQWYKNGTLISGATGQSYTITQSADYSVQITDANGCSATSDKSLVSLGIMNDNDNPLIRFYPNPANGLINVAITTDKPLDATIKVYNIMGSEVFTERFNVSSSLERQINLSNLEKGVYLIRFIDGNAFYNTRLLLQ